MNIVLYTRDMEPITIIDLHIDLIKLGEERGTVYVAVYNPPSAQFVTEDTPFTFSFKKVMLTFHKFVWFGNVHYIITVNDDELALALKPSWLPGQRGHINDYKRTINLLSDALVRTLQNGI